MSKIKRIGINTGGGDAPGLNAVIRAAVLSAKQRGWEVLGIRRGYLGLLDTRETVLLDKDSVSGIAHLGGTILGTSNRGNPFDYPVSESGGADRSNGDDGVAEVTDRSDLVVENFDKLGLDALIAIGGDGSMEIAHRLCAKGLSIVGVPKTIDNDLNGTVVTFGFHTAVRVATEAIDRLHSTAEAHDRVFTIEVMGRYAGWIALYAGLAGGADVILMPEIPFEIDRVCEKILRREARGRRFSLVVVAEGARRVGGSMTTKGEAKKGREVILGGIAEQVAREIEKRTGKETRTVILGHLQRGGSPTPYDRILALRFGAAAVRVIAEGKSSVMVALDPPIVRTVPLAEATRRMKTVPLDGDVVCSAREIGICMGDV